MNTLIPNVIDEFIHSTNEHDVILKEKIKTKIGKNDSKFNIEIFLSALLYTTPIDPIKHKYFKKILLENIQLIKNKYCLSETSLDESSEDDELMDTSSDSYYEDDVDSERNLNKNRLPILSSNKMCLYTFSQKNVSMNYESRNITIDWDIALRALCETILSDKWHKQIHSKINVPRTIICAIVKGDKIKGLSYINEVMMGGCLDKKITDCGEYMISNKVIPTPPSNMNYEINISDIQLYLKKMSEISSTPNSPLLISNAINNNPLNKKISTQEYSSLIADSFFGKNSMYLDCSSTSPTSLSNLNIKPIVENNNVKKLVDHTKTIREHFKSKALYKTCDPSDITHDITKFMTYVYAYTMLKYEDTMKECNKIIENNLNSKLQEDQGKSFVYRLIMDKDFIISHVIAYIFRKGPYYCHQNPYFGVLYIDENTRKIRDCLKKLEIIGREIRTEVQKGKFKEMIENNKDLMKYINDNYNIDKVFNKIQKHKTNVSPLTWQAIPVQGLPINKLYIILQKQCNFLESERLCKFMSDKSDSEYICLEIKSDIITEYEIESSIRKLFEIEPELPRKNHIIVNTHANRKFLVIYMPLLFSLRNVSYSYVFNSSNRCVKHFPMYPIYMLMMYTETKTKLENENKIAIRAVISTIVSWITNSRKVCEEVLHVKDDLFELYSYFDNIISRWWDDGDVMTMYKSINRACRSYKKELNNESHSYTLFSTILAFVFIRKPHFIKSSTLFIINKIMETNKEIKKKFPDLYEYYDRLFKFSKQNKSHKSINMNDPKNKGLTDGLWKNMDGEPDRYVMPWLDTYFLCCTNIISHIEARLILESIKCSIIPKARRKTRGKKYHMELCGRLTDYVSAFSTRYSKGFFGAKSEISYKDSLKVPNRTGLATFMRILEWVSLHSIEERKNIEIGIGPCNIDPQELIESPPLLPVYMSLDGLPIYNDESLFFCVDNSARNDSTGYSHLCDSILHHACQVSKDLNVCQMELEYKINNPNNIPNDLFSSFVYSNFEDSINTSIRKHIEFKTQEYYKKRKIDWSKVYNKCHIEYEDKRRKIQCENKRRKIQPNGVNNYVNVNQNVKNQNCNNTPQNTEFYKRFNLESFIKLLT